MKVHRSPVGEILQRNEHRLELLHHKDVPVVVDAGSVLDVVARLATAGASFDEVRLRWAQSVAALLTLVERDSAAICAA
jgi:hypothetical protein